ncbi:gfo/Idh/MocA family oxidoreductase [Kocuria koreensis]|jgi:predicted dehydrogenase|uniref:Gfo/Idh/MocA family oxidoreductase n=1 Tax=Rothia koreensis TaxID=592378 RepID=A0A7K1LK72_9MICC|nr:Gfo/Idh/MocA family oxidoreductase [Rothia koreensis]MUN55520.1 gfo/Idh/MocA family oxidoreductase [Rothia koreensis]
MAEQRTIGVGLISVGWMGKVHSRAYTNIPVFYPELGIRPRLIVAADTAEDRARYAVNVLGFERGTTDYHEVLNDPEVDVVSICAPNFLHAQIAKDVAEAGKAFWVEKPAGRSADETQAISDASDRAGVVSAVGFNYRNAPAIEYARQLVADGKLGRITNVRGAFFADYSADPRGALSWRFMRDLAGTGVLGDLMGHLIDLTHYVVGPIRSVTAATSTVYSERPEMPMGSGTHFAVVEDGDMKPVENEDYASMIVRCEQPASEGSTAQVIGVLEASRVANGPRASYGIEVYGTQGSFRWDFERMNELQLALNTAPHVGYTTIMADKEFGDFSVFQPGAGTPMGYDDLKTIEAKKFLLAYLGVESLHADIKDGVAASRVVSAAEESAETGAWQPVDEIAGTSAQGRSRQ